MKNGYDGRLAEKFSGLGINQHSQQHDQPHNQTNPSSDNDSLYQIMKAVETAEATIRQQVYLFQRMHCFFFLNKNKLGCYRRLYYLNVKLFA